MIDFEELVSVGDNLKVTDIFEDTGYDKSGNIKFTKGVQIKTINGDLIELYEDNTWEYFKEEE